jgi:transposase InsO family protein
MIGHRDILHLISDLDDCVRYIIYYSLTWDKRTETTSRILQNTLSVAAYSCALGSDNGGEFLGPPFTEMLQLTDTQTWHTRPQIPEQSGKVERFLGPLIVAFVIVNGSAALSI